MTLVDRAFAKLLLVGLAVIIIPWLATYATAFLIARTTAPEAVDARLAVLGSGVASDLGQYLDAGVPMIKAVGVSDYLAEDLAADSEIRTALVLTNDGKVVGSYAKASGAAAPPKYTAEPDWAALGLRPVSFTIAAHKQPVGRLIIAYDQSVLSAGTNAVTRNFLLVLAVAVIFGYEMVLVGYRAIVLQPLATLVTLERRTAERGFDRIAAIPHAGPLTAVVAALNKLVVAVNDRYARIYAHLLEIQEMSFNPNAPGVVASLRRQLEGAGRFAPTGLGELVIDHGDMLAGPVSFRTGIVLGVAALIGAPALSRLAPAVAAPAVMMVVLALAATLAVLLRRLSGRRLVTTGAVLAAAGLVASAFTPAPWSAVAAVATVLGAVAIAAIIPSGQTASLSRLVHGLAGIAVAAGAMIIDAGLDRAHYFTIVIGLAGLAGTLVQAGQMRGVPPRPIPPRRQGWATDRLEQADGYAALAAGWLAWVALGDAAGQLFDTGPTSSGGTPELVFYGSLATGFGMLLGLGIRRMLPKRFGPQAMLIVAGLAVMALALQIGRPHGVGALLGAVLLGLMATGGTALVMARQIPRLLLTGGSAILVGAALAAAGDITASPSFYPVMTAAIAFAAASILLRLLRRLRPGAAA